MKHYVYKIIELTTGEFYIGSRTCNCNIEDDVYMGSMKTWKPNKLNLVKYIIKDDFINRELATIYERDLIIKKINNPLNRNYNIPNTGFHVCAMGEKNPNYGKLRNDSWKSEHSKIMVEYYKSNKAANLGRKFDENWREKISKTRKEKGLSKGSNNSNSYGKVEVIDLDGNIMTFDTAKEAASILEADRFTLTNHCKNNSSYRRGKYKGWKFSLISNEE
jgi:hypothetical protein